MEEEAQVAVVCSEVAPAVAVVAYLEALVVAAQPVQPQLHQGQPHSRNLKPNQHPSKAQEWDLEEVASCQLWPLAWLSEPEVKSLTKV